MTKSKMLNLFVLLICLVGYFTATAQADYIVLTQGDTLKGGKVVFLNYAADQKVQYTDEHKKRTVYTMKQVRAFQLNGEVYHLVKLIDRYAYLKLMVPGYLSLYAFQPDNQQNWDGRYLYKKDGRGLEVPNLGFKKKMLDFITECDELNAEITSGDLGRSDLIEIINKYNTCIDQRTALSGLVNQQKIASVQKASTWNELEEKVKALENLDEKESILEMISEARAKTERGEKIPKFILEGLKKSLDGNNELKSLLAEIVNEIDH